MRSRFHGQVKVSYSAAQVTQILRAEGPSNFVASKHTAQPLQGLRDPIFGLEKPVSLLWRDFVDSHFGFQSLTSDAREDLWNPLIGSVGV